MFFEALFLALSALLMTAIAATVLHLREPPEVDPADELAVLLKQADLDDPRRLPGWDLLIKDTDPPCHFEAAILEDDPMFGKKKISVYWMILAASLAGNRRHRPPPFPWQLDPADDLTTMMAGMSYINQPCRFETAILEDDPMFVDDPRRLPGWQSPPPSSTSANQKVKMVDPADEAVDELDSHPIKRSTTNRKGDLRASEFKCDRGGVYQQRRVGPTIRLGTGSRLTGCRFIGKSQQQGDGFCV
ncbi:hypothetical protein [Absidia glauca]|uniref:Uncharacterized protein n=1 Tax=Absidia glauca TaxID=4829 RepID=A0A163JEZ1_ABSGL|nr:hypothetical protein [Absidia glauca]